MAPALYRLRLAACALRLELLTREGVIDLARELLPEMPSNQYLAQLTTAGGPLDEVVQLLTLALEAEGIAFPDEYRAGQLLARDIGNRILSGAVSPGKGARAIWWDVVRRVPALEAELGHFVGLASEWEDDPDHRAEYEDDIRSAAAELTSKGP